MKKIDPEFVRMLQKEDILWSELRMKYILKLIKFAKHPWNKIDDDYMILNCLKVCLSSILINGEKYPPVNISFGEFLDTTLPLLDRDKNEITEKKINIIRNHIWGYMHSKLGVIIEIANDYMDIEDKKEKVITDVEDIEDKAEVLYATALVALLEITLRKIEIQILEGEFYDNDTEQ